ncbi:hypothetical protein BDF22DRAFT_612737, partial [Syncephalis plumigaleata]
VINVNKLTQSVTEEHLREIFGVYGSIRSIELGRIERLNVHRGHATIEYETLANAEKAIECMNGGQLDGMTLVV